MSLYTLNYTSCYGLYILQRTIKQQIPASAITLIFCPLLRTATHSLMLVQQFICFFPGNVRWSTDLVLREEALCRVETCLADIMSWMHRNTLKLNSDKTEVILFSSKHNATSTQNISVKVGDSEIKPANCVKNLGAWFDSKMNMEYHVNSVSRSCYAQLRQIGYIRKYLTSDATKTLVNSLVTSRLDYCNALLAGLPKTTLNRLQTVQNTAARIVTRTSRFSHITPVLKDLHWLPIHHRIEFKLIALTYKALSGQSPEYIQDLLQVYRQDRDLRSQNRSAVTLVIPRNRTSTFGDRSFSSAAARIWNSLPIQIRNCPSFTSFKKLLKTHFFREHFEH